jgi:dGTPase
VPIRPRRPDGTWSVAAREAVTAVERGTLAAMPEIAGKTADAYAERIRELEERALSPFAVRSYETRGRAHFEDECSLRTPFQRDRDRIVHSKAFRRLKGKTQVFIDPVGDHYRTRITHTLETTAISRVVARALRLNEDLVEAIGLGHDMGHTPFGHAGEDALDEVLRERFGRPFRHNEQSFAIAQRLNLTHEVCDGILTHTGDRDPATLEGKIVRIVDRVAYINHDIDDAMRFGILREEDLPRPEIELLGPTGSARIDTLVHDLVETSEAAGDIRQSDEVGDAMLSLRSFMFERVYLGPQVEPEHRRGREVMRRVFDHVIARGDPVDDAVDYVAGMTDRFALNFAETLG